MNKNIVLTAVISSVAGGVLGGIVTYATVNKRLRTRYEDWANEEISAVKEHYKLVRKEDGDLGIFGDIKITSEHQATLIGQALSEAMIRDLGYDPRLDTSGEGEPEPDEDEHVPTNIFDRGIATDEDGNPLIDLEEIDGYEVISGEPYLISEDEYFNTDEYDKDTLSYYETDNTLADQHDGVIERVQEAIGERHLHMFNKKPMQAKNSIYVRNDAQKTDYEVILVEGAYSVIILGMNEEDAGLKEPKKRPKKMRDDD